LRLLVDLAEADLLAEAHVGLAVAVLGEGLLDQVDQRGVLGPVDVVRHRAGVALQPETLDPGVHLCLRLRFHLADPVGVLEAILPGPGTFCPASPASVSLRSAAGNRASASAA